MTCPQSFKVAPENTKLSMLRALGLLSLVAVATAQDIRSASQYEHMQAHENDASSYPQKPQQTQQSYHQPPEVHLQFNMPALNLLQ